MIRIAYQGAPGAYSQLAAREQFPLGRTLPMTDFDAVVRAVLHGAAEFGVLPLENSIIGAVTEAREALELHPGLVTVERLSFPVRHCLLALPGATIDVLRQVESHPAALAQCARFLSGHRLAPRPAYDTAGAARGIAMDRDFTRAAIASAEAAELHGLTVLCHDIADAPDNRTTFAIIARARAAAAA